MDRRTFLASGLATGSAATLAGCGAGARLTLLEGVGHIAHHAAPAELLGAIDRIAARA